jgi:hypothetical protein
VKLSDLVKYCGNCGTEDPELMIEGEYCVPAVVSGFDRGLTVVDGHAVRFVLLERDMTEDMS